MNRSPLERRYGHGAFRVPLAPALRRGRPLRTLRDGFAEAHRDGDALGESLRSVVRSLPALFAIAVALTFVFAKVLTPPPDESEITIVAFAAPPPEELPEPVVPEPQPVVPEPEPVPPPEPEPVVPEPLPAPEPPRAAPEPPRPEPPPRAEPPPPPKPQIQQIARIEPQPAPPTPPKRVQRQQRPPERSAPRLSFDPLAAPELETPPPQPTRAPVFAAARPPDARPRMDAPALRATPTPPAPEPPRATRRSAPAPERSRSATPQLAMAGSAPSVPSERPTPRRDTRRAPALPAPRRSSRGQVDLAVPEGKRQPKPRPRSTASARPRLEPPTPAPAARARAEEPGVRGVALGSLAACVSDRTEDALKQKVVARVGNRAHCQSPAGRYHFVETKNVNAFLMRIERAAGRRAGDRCEELTYALACLGGR